MFRSIPLRAAGAAAAVISMLASAGCESVAEPTTITVSTIELTASADPVTSVATEAGAEFARTATFDVTVAETAGVAATITNISANLSEASGGVLIGGAEAPEFAFDVDVETADVSANGSVRVTFNLRYTLASGGSSAAFDVTVVGIDSVNSVQVGDGVRVNIS
jgi:hypothetical protein